MYFSMKKFARSGLLLEVKVHGQEGYVRGNVRIPEAVVEFYSVENADFVCYEDVA